MSVTGVAATAPDLRLREAAATDGPAIAALHIASWRSAYRGMLSDAFLDGPIEAERGALWAGRFADGTHPDRIVVLAEAPGPDADGTEGRDLLAFCCILVDHDPVWGSLVDNLHVHPARKRGRLGRLVLGRAASLVAGPAADRPVHLFVLDANAAARAAYESWGGRFAERFAHPESDGAAHLIRRYVWDSPQVLAARLGAS